MIDFSKIKTLYIDGKEVKTFSLDGHEAWSYTPPTTLKPFTVENIDDTPNTYFPIQLKQYIGSATQLTDAIEYSVDDGQTWSNYTGSVYNLSCGQKISYRAREGVAVDATDVGIRPNGTTWFSTKLKVSGTLASLADKDMSGQHLRSFMFKEAFTDVANKLVDASELIMPQINGENAYEGSFYNCNKLSAAPKEISADLSGKQDYFWRTFSGCTSLKETPRMHFQNIQNDCMYNMFYSCSQLSSIYIDFTAWPTDNWHGGIASFGKFRCPASLGNDSTIERDNAKKCPLNWVVGNFETNGWLLDNVVTRGSLTAQVGQALDFSQLSIYDGCSCELLVKDRDFTVQLPQAPIIGTNTLTCSGIGQFSGTKTFQYQIVQGNAFRMTAKEANSTIELSSIGTPPSISLLSSTEGLAWEAWNGSKLTLANPEDSVYLKAASTNDGFAFDTTGSNRAQFVMGGKIAVDGSIMDLLGKDTLSEACFYKLFAGCSSLVEAPDLPATTLAPRCYTGMFNGCSQLSTAPDLPALSAEALCYQTMFRDCVSLTSAPALPATSLNSTCYSLMFFGCTSLSTAPALPATQLCSYCYWQMFGNCSSLTDAPVLPAENLISNCYQYMFKGCSSLSSAEVKFTDWLTSENATQDWLSGVAQTGTFTCVSALDTTTRGGTHVPASWTVVNPHPVVYAGYVKTNGYSLDTGYKPTVNTSLSTCLSGSANGSCFIGFYYGDDSQDYRVFNYGGTFHFDLGGGGSYGGRITAGGWDSSKWADISAWNYGFKFTPEGGSEQTATDTRHDTVDWDSNGTINIAGFDSSSGIDICVKGLKIYENGVLVKDFRPAVDSNSVACLHEEVEGVFYYPQGTTTWTAYEEE